MSTPGFFFTLVASNLIGRTEAEKTINPKPHFVPIDLAILEETLGNKIDTSKLSISELRTKIIQFVTRSTSKHVKMYTRGGSLYNIAGNIISGQNIRENTPAIVYEGSKIIGLMYAGTNSYKSVGRSFFTPFLNKEIAPFLLNSDPNGVKEFNIGHTIIDTTRGTIGTSPLNEQANNYISETSGLIDNKGFSKQQRNSLKTALDRMQQAVGNFTIHNEYSESIQNNLSKTFTKALLSVEANIVIIQDGVENKGRYAKLEGKFLKDLKNSLLDIHFSRSLKEEVVHRLVNAIEGKPSSDTKKKVSSGKQTNKLTKTPVVTGNLVSDLKAGKESNTSNLIDLQFLINTHLQDVISANMGDGSEKRILNYRTGRFAASAKVERLSESRAGLITAFYSYMKNPYQTFEPGFKQGSPKTRDPKLLIGNSIKEIAATVIGNRMRAVLV